MTECCFREIYHFCLFINANSFLSADLFHSLLLLLYCLSGFTWWQCASKLCASIRMHLQVSRLSRWLVSSECHCIGYVLNLCFLLSKERSETTANDDTSWCHMAETTGSLLHSVSADVETFNVYGLMLILSLFITCQERVSYCSSGILFCWLQSCFAI